MIKKREFENLAKWLKEEKGIEKIDLVDMGDYYEEFLNYQAPKKMQITSDNEVLEKDCSTCKHNKWHMSKTSCEVCKDYCYWEQDC